ARLAVRPASTALRSVSNFARASRASKASRVKTSWYSFSRLPRISNERVPMNHLFENVIRHLSGYRRIQQRRGLHRGAVRGIQPGVRVLCVPLEKDKHQHPHPGRVRAILVTPSGCDRRTFVFPVVRAEKTRTTG